MTAAEREELRDMIEEALDSKVIPKLDANDEKLDKVCKRIFGNGDVKGCLVWEIEEIKDWRKTVESSLKSIRNTPKIIWNYLNSGLLLLFVILSFIFRR
ncbi:MAG: hypothetical protein RDU76_06210 [Candidatus Edwardsbacteria bacterium]|nr:hypothetical protein [Candidatus Edwardsbacteria bacterium]